MSTFAFLPGESFNGAIARWAAENGAERMIDVTRAAGMTHAHRQTAGRADADAIAAVAREMGVDADALIALSTPLDGPDLGSHSRRFINGVSVPSILLENRRRRFAPAAFAASPDNPIEEGLRHPPHHRALWDFRLLPACTETWQYLVHRCGEDGCNDLGWHHTPGIDLCEHCMHDLAITPAETVEPQLREGLLHVAGLVHHDPVRRASALAALPPVIAELGTAVAVDLIYRLLPVIRPGLPTAPRPPADADQRLLAEAVSTAWRIVTDWPHGAVSHVASLVSRRATRHSDGNRGATMRFLDMPPLLGLRREVRDLAALLRAELDVEGPHGATIARATCTSNEGGRILALGTRQVAALRRVGVLATIPVLVHGTLQPRLSAADIDLITDGIGRRIGYGALQTRLGISHHGVEQLEALSVIYALQHPYFRARYAERQIDLESVLELELELTAAALGDPLRCTVPLVDAMKTIGGRMKPWGPVLDGMRKGRIPIRLGSGKGPLSRRILVDRCALDMVTGAEFLPPAYWKHPVATLVTKVDASETLNLGPNQATALLREFFTLRGSRAPSVPVERVLEIARQHMSCVELAARRGVDSATAYFDGKRDCVPYLGKAGFCRIIAEQTYFGATVAYRSRADAIGGGRAPNSNKYPAK